MADETKGNFAGGLLLGFLCSIVGVIIAFIFGEGKTRNGAVIGFIVNTAIGAIAGALKHL